VGKKCHQGNRRGIVAWEIGGNYDLEHSPVEVTVSHCIAGDHHGSSSINWYEMSALDLCSQRKSFFFFFSFHQTLSSLRPQMHCFYPLLSTDIKEGHSNLRQLSF